MKFKANSILCVQVFWSFIISHFGWFPYSRRTPLLEDGCMGPGALKTNGNHHKAQPPPHNLCLLPYIQKKRIRKNICHDIARASVCKFLWTKSTKPGRLCLWDLSPFSIWYSVHLLVRVDSGIWKTIFKVSELLLIMAKICNIIFWRRNDFPPPCWYCQISLEHWWDVGCHIVSKSYDQELLYFDFSKV